eukprot:COSAG02_NODE_55989_length_287_cov_1.622340_1_plen_27_part_01
MDTLQVVPEMTMTNAPIHLTFQSPTVA